MATKTCIWLASAAVGLAVTSAHADWRTDQAYRQGYQDGYSNGYNYGYDDGLGHHRRDESLRQDHYRMSESDRPHPHQRYERGAYYYGDDCRDQNTAVGTVLGAAAGGVIGNQFGQGSGRTAATIGGVILGGMAGHSIAQNISCEDRPYAFRTYREGLDGHIGRRYDWRNDDTDDYGTFTPTREYNRGDVVCRDYTEVTYRDGRQYRRDGTACRREDGNWHIES